MARPTGWDVLGLDGDPTPGVVESVQALAKAFGDFAHDAEAAYHSLNSFGSDATALQWVGQTADAFKGQFGPLPGRLQKLYTSYSEASDALSAYAPQLQAAQTKADTALRQAQDANSNLQRATSNANNAATDLKTAQQSHATTPNPQAVTDAQTAHDTAQTNLNNAKAHMAALAKQANDAYNDRINAAKTCGSALHHAQSDGIHNKHWWEHVGEVLSEVGGEIADIANELAPFLDILALATSWIPGVDVVTAALAEADNIIAIAGTAMKITGDAMQGHWGDALMGAGMLGLQFVGGRMLGKLGGEAEGEGRNLLGSAEKDAEGDAASTAERGGQEVDGNAGATTDGDPVDVVSGQMLTWDDDVVLPGVLPLILRRAYASKYDTGRLFGPGWASTLDQRLSVNAAGIHFVGDDAQTLHYALPSEPGDTVYPREGAPWPLVWDTAADEIRISDPIRGYTWHFPTVHYSEDTGQIRDLIAMSDRSGNRVEYIRDALGTPVEVRHSGGYRVAVDLRETASGQRISALRLVGDDAESALLIGFGYDERGRLSRVMDPEGNSLQYSWDEQNRITGWQDRLGMDYHYTYDERGRVVHGQGNHGFLTASFDYHDEERFTLVTDSDGNVTRYGYDERGRIVAVTDPAGNVELRELDRYGNQLSVVDEMGRATTFERDGLGQVLRSVMADGAETTTTWAAPGLPEQITDAIGAVWQYSYDAMGRLATETDPLGAVTSYEYTANGYLSRMTDPAGHAITVECDAVGLPVRVMDPDGSVTTTTRDAAGRISTLTDGSGRVTEQHYDSRGNLLTRIMPDGATWTFSYDLESNLSGEQAPDGSVRTWQYTFLNTLVGRTEADGAAYRFAYDGQMRLTTVTGPTGAAWRYEYNPVGHLVAETDFNGRRIDYERDAVGQMTVLSQAEGRRQQFLHDPVGRVLAMDADGDVTRYSFDAAGRMIAATAPGTELSRTYDAVGRLVTETVDGHAVSYRYDAAGRAAGLRLSQGHEASWEFSPGGALTRLSSSGHEIAFTTDAAGRATGWVADRKLSMTRGFDAAGRLAAQRVTFGTSALVARDFAYSPTDLLSEIRDVRTGTRRFELTKAGRVAGVQAEGWHESYAYDALGNLASTNSQNSESVVYVHDGTLISSAGRTVYRHDAMGRVVSKTRRLLSGGTKTWDYRWDARNRLVAARTPENVVWTYQYDPLGRRVGKVRLNGDGSVAEQIRFTWDKTRLAAVTAADGTVTTWDYLPDTFTPIAQHTHTPAAGSVDPDVAVTYDVAPVSASEPDFALVVTDPVGTPTELVSADGHVVWQQRRASIWGLPADIVPPDADEFPLRFPGQYHDSETGLHYNLNRYYDPEAAAYLTPDPLGLEPAPNQYGYVGNPLADSDPLGLYPASGNARGGNGSNENVMPKSQADDVAKYLGYKKTKEMSAGKQPIWVNKKAGGGQPKYITYDRTGHSGGIFKGASFEKPFQTTKDTGRDGTYDLDVDGSGNVSGLKWVAK
ncbi:YD repeat protein [Catenulispora acidiphila DSM 44928]|uniref:YD repeat protein n=1 Tax=Catenulispora acidiphila (strain DSM 44928 / JCM 14897 / NBRC 102108 / NRRL B-24433 / ID139908) TaxID=479433 RepID=C7Q0B8_CATAD|nr:toxin C-terminal domain-containing protein [Catenulispora acidiphila]ACU77451.1 YD repeat protein [Catenulispora acidiphila DSM 44928]